MAVPRLLKCGTALLVLTLTGSGTAGAQGSDGGIGQTVLVEPRVTRQGQQETEERPLEVGASILHRDTVRGDDETSRALLLIRDVFEVGVYLSGKSSMHLTTSTILGTDHCTTDEAASRLFAIEAEGTLRFLVAQTLAGCELEVHTDRAVVFIQGSDVRLRAEPGVTQVAVVEGRVTVRARDDRGSLGAAVVVTAGHSTLVREGKSPTFPAPFEPHAPLVPSVTEPPSDDPPELPRDPTLQVPMLLPPIGLAAGPS